MILYDWRKVVRIAGARASDIVLVLRSMLATNIPRNRRDPIFKYYYTDFSGHNFLVHPDKLIVNRHKWTDTEIANYIGIASFRNLGEYKAVGKVTLDLDHCPVSRDALNKNRLLRLEDGQIHFRYEDYT